MKNRSLRLISFGIVAACLILIFGKNPAAYASQAANRSEATSPSRTVIVDFGGSFGFSYSPNLVYILPGDSVRWQGDFAMHPLVSDDGLWQTVGSGTDFTHTFNQHGVYHYHCQFHGFSGMTGTVIVGYQALLPLVQK